MMASQSESDSSSGVNLRLTRTNLSASTTSFSDNESVKSNNSRMLIEENLARPHENSGDTTTEKKQETLSKSPSATINPCTLRSIVNYIQTLRLPNGQASGILRTLLSNCHDNPSISHSVILTDADLRNILLHPHMKSLSFSHFPATHWDTDYETLQWKCAALGHSSQAFLKSFRLLRAAATTSLPIIEKNPDEWGFQMEGLLKFFTRKDWLIKRYIDAIINVGSSLKIRPRIPIFLTPSWRGQKGKMKLNLPIVNVLGINSNSNAEYKRIGIIASNNTLYSISEYVKKKGEDHQPEEFSQKKEYIIDSIIPNVINPITHMSIINNGSFISLTLSHKLHAIYDLVNRELIAHFVSSSPVLDTMLETHHDALLTFTFVCKSGVVESWEVETKGRNKGSKLKVESSKIPMDCDAILCTAIITRAGMNKSLWIITGDGMGYVGVVNVSSEEFLCNLTSIGFAPVRAVPVNGTYMNDEGEYNNDRDSNHQTDTLIDEIRKERERCTIAWISEDKTIVITRIKEGEIRILFRFSMCYDIADVSFTQDGNTLCISCENGSVQLYNLESQYDQPHMRLILPGEESGFANNDGLLVTMYGDDMILGIGRKDGRIRICDTCEHAVSRRRHSGAVSSVAIVENGNDKIIVSSGEDGALIGWKVTTDQDDDGRMLWMKSKTHEVGVKHIEAWALGMASTIGFNGDVATWVVKVDGIELLGRVDAQSNTNASNNRNVLANSLVVSERNGEERERVEGATVVGNHGNSDSSCEQEAANWRNANGDESEQTEEWVMNFESWSNSMREESKTKARVRCEGCKIIENENDKVIGTLPSKVTAPHAWCISSDGSLLVTGLANGTVLWFDIIE